MVESIKKEFTYKVIEERNCTGGTHKSGGYISITTVFRNVGFFEYGKTSNSEGITQEDYFLSKIGIKMSVLEAKEILSLNRGYCEYDVVDMRLLSTLSRILPNNQTIKDVNGKLDHLKKEEEWLSWREYSDKKKEIQLDFLDKIKQIIKDL